MGGGSCPVGVDADIVNQIRKMQRATMCGLSNLTAQFQLKELRTTKLIAKC